MQIRQGTIAKFRLVLFRSARILQAVRGHPARTARAQPRPTCKGAGKAEPFRTSGGLAALRMTTKVEFRHNAVTPD